MKRLGLLWLLLLCCPAGAQPDVDCARSGDSRCAWADGGAPSPQEVAAQGDEVIRFLGSAALSPRNAFMAELRRDARGRVRLTLRDPDRPANAISQPAPARLWARLAALRARLLAGDAAARRRAADKRRGFVIVCTDATQIAIDSVLRGSVAHADVGSCDDPVVDPALDRLWATFYPLVPYCMKLTAYYRSFCASLAGDKEAAAAATRNVLGVAALICDPDADADTRPLIAADAVIAIADEPARPLLGALPELCKRGLRFEVQRLEARGNDIFVTGEAEEAGTPNPFPWLKTPGTQHWRIDGGTAKLEKWRIGIFGK